PAAAALRSRGGPSHPSKRCPETDPSAGSLLAHQAAHHLVVRRWPRCPGRFSTAEDRPGAAARGALRAAERALRANVFTGTGGGSERNSRHGLAGDCEAIRIARISPVTADSERRADAGAGSAGGAKEHQALRQAPDHLVPQGTRRRMVRRIRRPAVRSAGGDRSRPGLLRIRAVSWMVGRTPWANAAAGALPNGVRPTRTSDLSGLFLI